MIEKLIEGYNKRIPHPKIRSVILHGMFWFVWLSRNLYDVLAAWGWRYSLVFITVVFISQAPMVYMHLYILVPKFLNRRKYALYFLLTFTLIFAYSHWNYALMESLPREGMPSSMDGYLQRLKPNFDLLEGVIVVILTYSLKYTLIAFITQNELLRLQKEKLSLELNALKAQVHPHFLFNTLNNLYSLTLKNSDKASEVVLKLSDIMRYVLYQANEEKVPLVKEIDFIRNFIELQKLRYSDRYKISFEVNGSPDGLEVAPLIFIDFTENSFKHGPDKRFNDGFVSVKIEIKDKIIHFHSMNSKSQGEETLPKSSSQGIGLSNVKRRLALIYNGNYDLEIKDQSEIYEVNLTLKQL